MPRLRLADPPFPVSQSESPYSHQTQKQSLWSSSCDDEILVFIANILLLVGDESSHRADSCSWVGVDHFSHDHGPFLCSLSFFSLVAPDFFSFLISLRIIIALSASEELQLRGRSRVASTKDSSPGGIALGRCERRDCRRHRAGRGHHIV